MSCKVKYILLLGAFHLMFMFCFARIFFTSSGESKTYSVHPSQIDIVKNNLYSCYQAAGKDTAKFISVVSGTERYYNLPLSEDVHITCLLKNTEITIDKYLSRSWVPMYRGNEYSSLRGQIIAIQEFEDKILHGTTSFHVSNSRMMDILLYLCSSYFHYLLITCLIGVLLFFVMVLMIVGSNNDYSNICTSKSVFISLVYLFFMFLGLSHLSDSRSAGMLKYEMSRQDFINLVFQYSATHQGDSIKQLIGKAEHPNMDFPLTISENLSATAHLTNSHLLIRSYSYNGSVSQWFGLYYPDCSLTTQMQAVDHINTFMHRILPRSEPASKFPIVLGFIDSIITPMIFVIFTLPFPIYVLWMLFRDWRKKRMVSISRN